MPHPYDYTYFRPSGKEQGAMAIGSLLAGLLSAAQPRQPGEASPALKGIAGAVGGYGSGYKAYQDMMQDAWQRDMYDKKYGQEENQFDQQMGLSREKFGEEKRQYEETEKPYKEAYTKYLGGKEAFPAGMGRMNEYSAFKGMNPEEQGSYLDYLSKTGYNRVLGMDETGNPIFVPTRGNVQLKTPTNIDVANTKTPAVSGKDIQPFVRPTIPTEAIKDIADFKTLLDLSKQIKDAYVPSYSGAIQGRYSKVKENWTGGLPDEQLKFNQGLESIKNRLLYLRTGKQINEQEFKRMMEELPDVRLPDNTVRVRLDNFYKMSEDLYNNRMKTLGGAGYRNVDNIEQGVSVGQPPAASQQSMPKESVLQELFDLAQKGDPEALEYFRSKGIK